MARKTFEIKYVKIKANKERSEIKNYHIICYFAKTD